MKENKSIIIFLIKAIGLYLLWFLIYDLWLKKTGVFDDLVVDNVVYFCVQILTGLGYMINVDYHSLGIPGGAAQVFVGSGCNGVEMMALFAGFVIIFEGNWKHKLWFIPLGIIILHFLNILRVISLMFIAHDSLESLDFNHKYTFTIILYILTFVGWMIWVKYFSKTKKSAKNF
ncbi:MAG: exosortase X [Vicingaceae bacterium]